MSGIVKWKERKKLFINTPSVLSSKYLINEYLKFFSYFNDCL